MADNALFVYVATYKDVEEAKLDYQEVRNLYSDAVIGAYDAAVINKDTDGTVQSASTRSPPKYGAWSGLVVRAAISLFFPAYLIAEPGSEREPLREKSRNLGLKGGLL